MAYCVGLWFGVSIWSFVVVLCVEFWVDICPLFLFSGAGA